MTIPRSREGRVRSFDGTEIAYFVGGHPGDGKPAPALVLSNGLGGTYHVWRHQIAYFAERYRFVSWDYRGLYRSGRPADLDRTEIVDHVRDALAVLQAENIESAVFVGWSMGVQVNFELYRTRPDLFRGIVVLNGVAGRPWDTLPLPGRAETFLRNLVRVVRVLERPAGAALRRVARWPELVTYAKRLGIAGPTLDEEVFHDLAADFATLDLECYLSVFERLGEHDARDVLPHVEVPTLVIAGERDRFTPLPTAREMVRSIPRADLLIVPGGTHYAAIEYPELINLRMEKFLRERLGD